VPLVGMLHVLCESLLTLIDNELNTLFQKQHEIWFLPQLLLYVLPSYSERIYANYFLTNKDRCRLLFFLKSLITLHFKKMHLLFGSVLFCRIFKYEGSGCMWIPIYTACMSTALIYSLELYIPWLPMLLKSLFYLLKLIFPPCPYPVHGLTH
jgi:hypothetical protein